ncbi:MSHA biogenesis protein MshK [Shewanella sp. YIC-542]|uniref:MSHA biogenesis protein MshK n=1 Tax=Shewanella mytili TaxID=3377111 RepID=UPI00398E9177
MWHPINVILIAWLLLWSASAPAASLRDPTRPPLGAASAADGEHHAGTPLVLNSIIQGASGARAIINNQLYRPGDRLQDTVIRRINANDVMLADGRRLRLFQTITESKQKR